MGIKASPTCVLRYGDDGDGAVGYLIGEENAGHALHVHDDEQRPARRSGLEGLALAERAYQQARRRTPRSAARAAPPARRRASSRSIIDHPDVRRMLLTMKASHRGACGRSCYIERRARSTSPSTTPTRPIRDRASELVDLLTPIVQGLVHRPRRRADVARHPGARRHGLHRGDRRRPALPRRQHHPDLRGHQRHPGDGPRRPQAAAPGRRRVR